MPFASVEQAIQDIRDGKLVIVADDEQRENEGDLVGAARSEERRGGKECRCRWSPYQ